MKIYLASRYSRREELCVYRTDLERIGHVVTSRWLNGNHQIDDAGLSAEAKAEERSRFATEDWADLMDADAVVSFTEEPRGTNSRGGRHVEFGAGLAAGKLCFVVGPRENVFHCLPTVRVYEPSEWPALLNEITPNTLRFDHMLVRHIEGQQKQQPADPKADLYGEMLLFLVNDVLNERTIRVHWSDRNVNRVRDLIRRACLALSETGSEAANGN